MHGFSGNNTRGLELDSLTDVGINGALGIDGNTEGIDDSSAELLSNRYIDNSSNSLDNITFLNLSKVKILLVPRLVNELLTCRYPRRQYQHYQSPG